LLACLLALLACLLLLPTTQARDRPTDRKKKKIILIPFIFN